MTVLTDGTGSGFEAKITSKNRLTTLATTLAAEHDAALEGDAYFATTQDTAETLTVTTTGGPILYLKNTSTTQNMILSKVLPSTDQAATTLKIVRDPTLGSIGNNNTHTPVNANAGSSKTASVTAYNWNEVGDGMTGLSAGSALALYILGVGISPLPIDDAIVVPPGTSMSFEMQAVGSTSECALNVRFYYEDVEV